MMTAGFVMVVVLVGLLTAVTGSAAAQSAGFVDVDASDLEGSGTAADPYLITNVSELQAIEDDVNANYTLGNDIDASQTTNWNNGAGFDPIDDLGGTLDGAGHSIQELTINRPNETNVGLFLSISYRDKPGQVHDLIISNAVINGGANVGILAGVNDKKSNMQDINIAGTVTGNTNVGGVVGVNLDQAEIQNVSADATVNGNSAGGIAGSNQDAIIENASTTGTINGGRNVGGAVGSNKGIIKQTTTDSTVDGSEFVGGLVGYNYNATILSSAHGSVNGSESVGGLVGSNSGNISRTYATGSVDASSEVGGLIGQSFREESYINESFATGDVSGQSNVGGLIGSKFDSVVENTYWDTQTTNKQTSAGGTGLMTAEMTDSAAETNMAGFAFDTIWQTQPNDYPVLASFSDDNTNGDDGDSSSKSTEFVDVDASDLEGSGTTDDPYIITNASELQAAEDDLDANYTLDSDIDASVTAQANGGLGFDPIGKDVGSNSESAFRGSFDGQGYTIYDLTVDRPSTTGVGLFATIRRGSIRDVDLRNVDITGDERVGGLSGESNGGMVQNVSVTGSITGTDSVGGLLGYNYVATSIDDFVNPIVQNSSAGVSVSSSRVAGGLIANNQGTVQNVSTSGSVDGVEFVGGLVGNNDGEGPFNDPENIAGVDGTIENAYSVANVNGSSPVGGLVGGNGNEGIIRESFATGTVTGSFAGGGLIGEHEGTVVQNVYASGNVTVESRAGGLIGELEGEGVEKTYATGKITVTSEFSDPGGLFGSAREVTVTDSYWDTQSTGSSSSYDYAPNSPPDDMSTGLTTNEMQGDAARTNMDGLEFGTVWETQQDDYPRLLTQVRTPPSPPVSVSVISLEPSTVSSDSPSTHELVLEAESVSADGEDDQFNITFPDSVTLEGTPEVTVAELSGEPTVTTNGNTMRFTVDPTGEQSTRTLTVTANVTLSANN